MGVPDSSLLDIIDKVRSWTSWGRTSLLSFSPEFDMATESCCCECKLEFNELCDQYSCQGCRRRLCGSCVRGSGSLIVIAAFGGDHMDNVIKGCKFCSKTSKRHAEKIYPSESPRESPEPQSPAAPDEKADDCAPSAVVYQDHNFSPQKVNRRRSLSFGGLSSRNSFRCSPIQSDEEAEETVRHFFSSRNDYYHDNSYIDISSVSLRNECYSFRSTGSSPLDSPSRFNISTPRAGHSVQKLRGDSPRPPNGYPSSPDAVAVLRMPRRGTRDPEKADGQSDESTIILKQNEKLSKHLGFENNGHIWFPPPPEDEDDEAERSYFDYDDDDGDFGASGRVFSSSSSLDSLFPAKENQNEMQKEPLKAVINGHFRALVSQLLQGEGIKVGKETGTDDWLDIVSTLAWQAANFVKPDTRKGGSMDPGNYVKIKCVASGSPSESTLIKGVVCTKNIKHKRMTSQYKSPRLLILGGSLEYQRAQTELASFNTLLEEEMNHLKVIVSKIEAHRPNVLLVEKSVASYAQEYLFAKEISLVLNIKKPLLERIARCTGASITPSVDKISVARLGHCELFRLEKVSEDLETANQFNKKLSKTLMYFEGCPRRLCCTVLLKGLCREELKKIKHVVQYAVFAAYHLSLETSFLADEGAHLPKIAQKELPQDNMFSDNAALPQPISDMPATSQGQDPTEIFAAPEMLVDMENDEIEPALSLLDSASPVVDGRAETLMSHDSQDGSVCNADVLSNVPVPDSLSPQSTDSLGDVIDPVHSESLEAMLPVKGQLREVENIDDNVVSVDYLAAPESQQSILVSFSSHCVSKGTLCERSRLLRIKFYGSFDKPLGKYLLDDLFDQVSFCRSCKEPSEAHVQCYTHRQGVLTINVRRLETNKLPGERDGKIWMWHRCLRCAQIDDVPPATRRVIMSDAAWGLSFGKFLELSFSNHATANRLASCGHSLQRDCLRFYGFGSMVAFFHYSPIDIITVQLPPSVLEFNAHSKQEWIQREVEELQSKMETLYTEVTDVLHVMEQKCISFCNGAADSSDLYKQIIELKDLIDRERNEYYGLLQLAFEEPFLEGDGTVDILELNQMRQSLLICSRAWDRRLYSLDSLLNSESFTFEATEETRPNTEMEELKNSESTKDSNLSTDLVKNDSGYTEAYISECSNSEYSHLHQEERHEDGKTTISDNSSESMQSPASYLSDKIDSAWTGSDVDASPTLPVGQINQADNLPLKRLMAPSRVYSFDSATRMQEKIRRKMLPPSHFSATRSFHGSGDYRSMFKDSTTSVMRTYSQVFQQESQFTPPFISSVTYMAEGPRLLLPQTGQSELVIAVYDDEPTSVISYALNCKEYEDWVADTLSQHDESGYGKNISREDSTASTFLPWQSFGSLESDYINYGGYGSEDTSQINMLSSDMKRSCHLKISFRDDSSFPGGKAKFFVTCYFAKQFDMLREKCCPSKVDFVRSLSRCRKWNAQGGKSNVYFAKSMDDRFIIKQVTKTELESFQEFAFEYFKYLNDSLDSGSPTCLAKVLGIFQVTVKNLKTGRETKMDLMVMENLFFARNISKIYDLKGCTRSRYNADKTGANKVLLDMNLLETLRTNPIFLGSKAKRRLERAVWNDTSFLAYVDVMDYSLLVGVDEERKELVLGIIDFMRQYTWDKHLETWVKASGILGGPKNESPTIISPKQYKRRFRKAMTTYFLTIPEQWSS